MHAFQTKHLAARGAFEVSMLMQRIFLRVLEAASPVMPHNSVRQTMLQQPVQNAVKSDPVKGCFAAQGLQDFRMGEGVLSARQYIEYGNT